MAGCPFGAKPLPEPTLGVNWIIICKRARYPRGQYWEHYQEYPGTLSLTH